MKIIDTAGQVGRGFFCQPFDLEKWRAYAAGISPELARMCLEDVAKYDFDRQVAPVLQASLSRPDKLRQLHASFLGAVGALRANGPALLGASGPAQRPGPQTGGPFGAAAPQDAGRGIQGMPLFAGGGGPAIVLYLGLCCAAGRATRLEGVPAILLGIEKIIELDWCDETAMKALLFHELGHLWHESLRGELEEGGSPRQRAVLQVYSEGVAMVCQQRLAGDPELFHQDRDGWLGWCRANEGAIKAGYLRRMEAGESTQGFFGDWVSFMGQPDVGYFLGRQFVAWLLGRYTLAEAAVLPYSQLESSLAAFLQG